MKKCPFCAEEIQDEAIKCKHCGEFLKETKKVSQKTTRKKNSGCMTVVYGVIIIIFAAYIIPELFPPDSQPVKKRIKTKIDLQYDKAKKISAKDACRNKEEYKKLIDMSKAQNDYKYLAIAEKKYNHYSEKCIKNRKINKIFSEEQLCKASLAAIMYQDPQIISVDKKINDTFYLSYIRPSDQKKWAYCCKLVGNKFVWKGTEPDQRWRNSIHDPKITYKIKGTMVSISEAYGDGSSTENSYLIDQL